MAVGGGVRVPSTSAAVAAPALEVWARKKLAGAAARRGAATIRCSNVGAAGVGATGGLAEEHYRMLWLRPGATRGEVKKAFRCLVLMMLVSNMREAEEGLEYWRLKYGLTDEDLHRYRYYLNDNVDD